MGGAVVFFSGLEVMVSFCVRVSVCVFPLSIISSFSSVFVKPCELCMCGVYARCIFVRANRQVRNECVKMLKTDKQTSRTFNRETSKPRRKSCNIEHEID